MTGRTPTVVLVHGAFADEDLVHQAVNSLG